MVQSGARLTVACMLGLHLASMAPAASQTRTPAACARTDYEAAVDGAGELLRSLSQKNSPAFQAKLRALKDKRGWTYDQFVTEGSRLVKDDKIAALDSQSSVLLDKINGAGGEAAPEPGSDCQRLDIIKADMAALVAIQNEKWTYMFANIDAELAK